MTINSLGVEYHNEIIITDVDDSFFAGGASLENLKGIFPQNKCKVLNMVLSYEFINNYDFLRAVINSLL